MFPSKQVPSWIPFLGIWQGQDGNRTHKTDLPLTSGSDWRTSHEAVPLLTFLRALFTKRAQELQRHSQAAASRHGVFHPPRGKVSFGSLSSWEGPCRHYPLCWIKRITLMLQWRNLESWRAEWKLLCTKCWNFPPNNLGRKSSLSSLCVRGAPDSSDLHVMETFPAGQLQGNIWAGKSGSQNDANRLNIIQQMKILILKSWLGANRVKRCFSHSGAALLFWWTEGTPIFQTSHSWTDSLNKKRKGGVGDARQITLYGAARVNMLSSLVNHSLEKNMVVHNIETPSLQLELTCQKDYSTWWGQMGSSDKRSLQYLFHRYTLQGDFGKARWNKLSFAVFQLLSASGLPYWPTPIKSKVASGFIDYKCKILTKISCPSHWLFTGIPECTQDHQNCHKPQIKGCCVHQTLLSALIATNPSEIGKELF